jgi:hypothetical protein
MNTKTILLVALVAGLSWIVTVPVAVTRAGTPLGQVHTATNIVTEVEYTAGLAGKAATNVVTSSLVWGETPAGTVDGANTSFYLAANPVSQSRMAVWSDATRLWATNSWSLTATNHITFVVAPSNVVVRVDYVK